MSDAVVCRGLSKAFGEVRAVVDVDLDVARGEILALLGPSGCGKTTLLRLIAGLERPEAGSVLLADDVVTSDDVMVPPDKRRVGFVFQDYALFPHRTVRRNVAFGVRDRRTRRARVDQVLAMVGLTAEQDRYPHELSGGQQQRVALARAIAPSPAVVLLDEPFSNLDADLRARVRTEVRDILHGAGATAVFVTHDQQEALEIADRVAVMREGRIEQIGTPEEVYHVPTTRAVADFVGEASFLPARLEGGVIATELGDFPVEGAEDEGPMHIMVRPEDVTLTSDPEGDCVVVERRFQGPIAICTVRLPSDRTVSAAHDSQVLFPEGEHVSVAFDPDHLVLFDGERRALWAPTREHTGTDLV